MRSDENAVLSSHSTSQSITAPVRERVADIDVLRWSGPGRGAPFVLLHGIGSNARSWGEAADCLSGRHELIAWDAPGYGESRPLPAMDARPDDYADALERLLHALGVGRVILVGHSLGCLFAARFAASRPDQVAGLALLSPALGYGVEPGAPLPPRVQARIDDLDRLGAQEFAKTRAANLVFEPERHAALVSRVREGMAAVRQPGYGQAVRALAAGDLMRDASLIAAPTLVGVGAQDAVTPPAGARALAGALKNAVGLFEADGVGHALPQQAPARVAEWLETLREACAHD